MRTTVFLFVWIFGLKKAMMEERTGVVMTNFQKLLEQLKEAGLPAGKWAVFGSGPMAVRGLKDPHDLDIIVTEDVYGKFKSKPNWDEKQATFDNYLESKESGVELWHNWRPGEWDIKELIQNSEIINGIRYVSLENVLKWKKLMGRKKDIKDIKTIEKFINNGLK